MCGWLEQCCCDWVGAIVSWYYDTNYEWTTFDASGQPTHVNGVPLEEYFKVST